MYIYTERFTWSCRYYSLEVYPSDDGHAVFLGTAVMALGAIQMTITVGNMEACGITMMEELPAEVATMIEIGTITPIDTMTD